MPSVEKISLSQWRDPRFRQKWLIGGLVASIPLVNILFLGYVMRYIRRLRQGDDIELPEWDEWGELLNDGLEMLGLILIYLGIPLLFGGFVAWLFSGFFHAIGLSFFGLTIAMVPITAAILFGSLLTQAALQQFIRNEDWGVMTDWRRTLRLVRRMLPGVIVPTLAYFGFMAVGWPLLGFSIFLGLLPLIAYSTAVYLKESGISSP